MADVKVPYTKAGLAAFEVLDNYTADLLISGSWPSLSPGYPLPAAAEQTFEKFHVVGLDSGLLVPAVWHATYSGGGIRPVGVITQALITGVGENPTVPVFYAGCFNPDMLVWDDSFDTAAKKRTAFVGAASPTQILIRERG